MKLRFAPSPTGLLHAGNARTALLNWLFARRHGGAFLLRIDDTDRERSRPELEAAIAQDLRWLGLDWDESFRQSDRLDRYAEAADRLRAAGRLYPCFESEEELRSKREARRRRGLPPVYDRAMLKLTPEQRAAAEASGKLPYWRFLLSPGSIVWNDLVLGARQVKLSAVSDPVVVRADGMPTYSFASAVDDLETGVSHILRGDDHVTNAAVQLDLYAALGGDPASLRLGHLPLLVGEAGGKLSKRLDAASLRALRQDGIEPTALAAYLARLGTSEDPVPLPLPALAATFDLRRVSHAPPRFDGGQLLALNRRVLQALDFDAVRERLPTTATPEFWTAVRGNLDLLSEARDWWEVVAGTIVPPPQPDEAGFLQEAAASLPPEPWEADVWSRWTGTLREATGRRGRALFHPLRLALTGEEEGPPMQALLPLIGRHRAASRL
ncbi:MAG TPA: glutamate--tRNA ligase, partial [Acetobacteraceae bacterium]|nr:glutamate--tRNA ligase [Acetobacteraceae bacterium]